MKITLPRESVLDYNQNLTNIWRVNRLQFATICHVMSGCRGVAMQGVLIGSKVKKGHSETCNDNPKIWLKFLLQLQRIFQTFCHPAAESTKSEDFTVSCMFKLYIVLELLTSLLFTPFSLLAFFCVKPTLKNPSEFSNSKNEADTDGEWEMLLTAHSKPLYPKSPAGFHVQTLSFC